MLCISYFSTEVVKFSVKMMHLGQCGDSEKSVHLKSIAVKPEEMVIFTQQLSTLPKEGVLSCLKCN